MSIQVIGIRQYSNILSCFMIILPVSAGGLPFLIRQERKQRTDLGEALTGKSFPLLLVSTFLPSLSAALPQDPLPAAARHPNAQVSALYFSWGCFDLIF